MQIFSIEMINFFLLTTIMVFTLLTSAAPHIIGGALNTDIERRTTTTDGTDNVRSKRQANRCQIPKDLPQTVQELNPYLNANQFLGLNPDSSSHVAVPANQPQNCSEATATWPGIEDNLRSNCPWIFVEKDFGENIFPRYVQEAKCLCALCIGAGTMGCAEVKHTVTVMRRMGCKDGLAVMTQETQTITVGCTCEFSGPKSKLNRQMGPEIY